MGFLSSQTNDARPSASPGLIPVFRRATFAAVWTDGSSRHPGCASARSLRVHHIVGSCNIGHITPAFLSHAGLPIDAFARMTPGASVVTARCRRQWFRSR